MAGAIVQSAYAVDDSGGTSTTISATLNGVAAGSAIVAHAGWADIGSTTTATASDGTSYTSSSAGKIRNASDNEASQVFYLANASSGTHTVTITLSAAQNFRRLRIAEISGVATSSIEDKSAAQQQSGVGTGTNSISSGDTATTTNADIFVLGFTQDTTNVDPGSGTMAAGTGYTLSGSNQILALESKNVSATGTHTATFTDTKNSGRTTHVLALKNDIPTQVPTYVVSRPTNLLHQKGHDFRSLLNPSGWF